MVVLNQDAVTQVKAVVVPATHAYGVLLQQSETGGGLAGIGNTGR